MSTLSPEAKAERTRLIKIIHVAKRQLGLADEEYRAVLAGVANGKESCGKLNLRELKDVANRFIELGFKVPRLANGLMNGALNSRPKKLSPSSFAKVKVNEVKKIRALWIDLHRRGAVEDGSETALNAWCRKMTAKMNDGIGVGNVGWLSQEMAIPLLEALKQWSRRVEQKDD